MKQTLYCVLLWISLCFKLVCSFIEWTNLYDIVRLQFLIVPVYKYCPIFLCKFSNLYFHDYIAKWIFSLVVNWWTLWSNMTKRGLNAEKRHQINTCFQLHKTSVSICCVVKVLFMQRKNLFYTFLYHTIHFYITLRYNIQL